MTPTHKVLLMSAVIRREIYQYLNNACTQLQYAPMVRATLPGDDVNGHQGFVLSTQENVLTILTNTGTNSSPDRNDPHWA